MQKPSENSKVGGNNTGALAATSARIAWPEYLTIASMFTVVWVHVTAGVIKNAPDSYVWWASNIAESVARWPVPIFVMLSGYFLLDPAKNYTIGSFYRKRVARVLIPIIFWSVFYIAFSLYQRYLAGQPVGLKHVIGPVVLGLPYYHLWYLYMLAGLYLFTPFLRKIISSSIKQELVFLCMVIFVFAMLVDAANFFYFRFYDTETNGSLFVTWSFSYLGYFLAGYLLGKVVDIKIGLSGLVCLLLLSMAATAIGIYMLTERYSYTVGCYFGSNLGPNVVITSLAVFLIAKRLSSKVVKAKFISNVSLSMLGVYVMHPFFIVCLGALGFKAINFNPVIGIPLVTVCVFLICLVLSEVIKRIPFVNRII